jgi:hypothetical protein
MPRRCAAFLDASEIYLILEIRCLFWGKLKSTASELLFFIISDAAHALKNGIFIIGIYAAWQSRCTLFSEPDFLHRDTVLEILPMPNFNKYNGCCDFGIGEQLPGKSRCSSNPVNCQAGHQVFQ